MRDICPELFQESLDAELFIGALESSDSPSV